MARSRNVFKLLCLVLPFNVCGELPILNVTATTLIAKIVICGKYIQKKRKKMSETMKILRISLKVSRLLFVVFYSLDLKKERHAV